MSACLPLLRPVLLVLLPKGFRFSSPWSYPTRHYPAASRHNNPFSNRTSTRGLARLHDHDEEFRHGTDDTETGGEESVRLEEILRGDK